MTRCARSSRRSAAWLTAALDAVFNSRPVQAVAGFIRTVIAKMGQLVERGKEAVAGLLGGGADDEAADGGSSKAESSETEDLDDEKRADLEAAKASFATEEKQFAPDGRINQGEAKKVAQSVKRRHPVLATVSVIDGGDSWNYAYTVQRTDEIDTPGTTKEEGKDGGPMRVSFSKARHLLSVIGTKGIWAKAETTIILEDISGR